MIWTVANTACGWLKLSKLEPVRVLDELDGPRLFTVKSDDGQNLLAYMCGEDSAVERFLLVPTSDRIVKRIECNELSLRDALTQQAVMVMIDQRRDGSLGDPVAVDFADLPTSALPRAGTFLSPLPRPLISVRLIGDELIPGRVPASVVKRAVDGVTGAVRTLIRHVLDVPQDTGRPTDSFRRYYDLPATAFAFRSFEVSFGRPEPQDLADDSQVLNDVSELLTKGLEWASATDGQEAGSTREWAAVVEAISHLTPPQKGIIESVEIGGLLTKCSRQVFTLSREASERVSFARKKLASKNPSEVAYEGVVREFDKDQMTFWLRTHGGADILHVSFTPDQYDDALLAFDTEKLVTVFAYRASESKRVAELISIAFKAEPDEANTLPSIT